MRFIFVGKMITNVFRPRRRTTTLLKLGLIFIFIFFVIIWIKGQLVSYDSSAEKFDPQALKDEQIVFEKPAKVEHKDERNPQHNEEQEIVVAPVVRKPQEPSKKVENAVIGPLVTHRDEDDNRYDKEIKEAEAKIIPSLGAGGKGVELSSDESKLVEIIMKKEAFNIISSDKMSYNRSLPDVRSRLCKHIRYDSVLPSASVIIIFNNEAWSSLIRTIWSVINRSPAQYLKEIVLIDDFSDREVLGGRLERYIETKLPKIIRLVRLKERQGLIRARLAGAKEAVGDVIIFLDSHCEVFADSNIVFDKILMTLFLCRLQKDGWSLYSTESRKTGGPFSSPSST